MSICNGNLMVQVKTSLHLWTWQLCTALADFAFGQQTLIGEISVHSIHISERKLERSLEVHISLKIRKKCKRLEPTKMQYVSL